MDNDDRAKLVERIRSARKVIQEVWGNMVALEPEDRRAITDAQDVYHAMLKLEFSLISSPVEGHPGAEQCAFCGRITGEEF